MEEATNGIKETLERMRANKKVDKDDDIVKEIKKLNKRLKEEVKELKKEKKNLMDENERLRLQLDTLLGHKDK